MLEFFEGFFHGIVAFAILLLEIVGVAIIVYTAYKALLHLIQGREGCRIEMAEGIATALTFLLGGEAMKTIIAPDWHELGMTCAILLMRAAMSLLIHWETKSEKEATGGAEIGK